MGWSDWHEGSRSDGSADKASFKSSSDGNGNYKAERISRTEDSGSRHEHSIYKTNGSESKEIWVGENASRRSSRGSDNSGK